MGRKKKKRSSDSQGHVPDTEPSRRTAEESSGSSPAAAAACPERGVAPHTPSALRGASLSIIDAAVSPRKATATNVLRVRVIAGKSSHQSKSRRLNMNTPIVTLCEHDSIQLGMLDHGDTNNRNNQLLLLHIRHKETEDHDSTASGGDIPLVEHDRLIAATIAHCEISSSTTLKSTGVGNMKKTTPTNSNSKKQLQLSPGFVSVCPSSIYDALFPFQEKAIIEPSISIRPAGAVTTQSPSMSSPISLPTQHPVYGTTVSPTSEDKTGFSFKSMITTTTTTPVGVGSRPGATSMHSPPSTPSAHRSSPFYSTLLPTVNNDLVYLVPLHSALGYNVSTCLCHAASRIVVQVGPDDNNPTNRMVPASYASSTTVTGNGSSNCNPYHVLERLILAHCINWYMQKSQIFHISYQGKTIALNVIHVEGADPLIIENDLSNKLNQLHIDTSTSNQYDSDDASLVLRAAATSMIRLFLVGYDTTIKVVTVDDLMVPTNAVNNDSNNTQQWVAGLDTTLEQVQQALIIPLTQPDIFLSRQMKPPRGVLLHGPTGVGKTSMARQLAMMFESFCTVQFVNCASLQSQSTVMGQAEHTLMQYFQLGKQSKLLILDDIHLICPVRGSSSSNVGTDRLASTLLALLDGIESTSVNTVTSSIISSSAGTTRSLCILAITSSPSLLDPALRRPGRLDVEIEVPLPDEPSTRAAILKFQLDRLGVCVMDCTSDEDWLTLGKVAKGFNGADCMLAAKEAIRGSFYRTKQQLIENRMDSGNSNNNNSNIMEKLEASRIHEICLADVRGAIRMIKPSAIKSITVEIPHVLWSSIGGMDHVKQQLREAIDMPLQYGSIMDQLGIRPPRGVLLYGPPGCSKTLMARALATEGQMNFLTVKGPELLSKWLGESERAMASLFRRARMASPSIIFFDEIDAIACRRGSGDSSSSTSRLLSQLLTELDGIHHHHHHSSSSTSGSSNNNNHEKQQKKQQQRVVVVAATNRPDLLDTALIRPGRIDRMIYVGIPDEASRYCIFEVGLNDKACGSSIDISYLAQDEISYGYSGAEIIAICRDAALFALEEEDEGTTTNNPEHHHHPTIEMRHVLQAIQGMPKQITQSMLDFYRTFGSNR